MLHSLSPVHAFKNPSFKIIYKAANHSLYFAHEQTSYVMKLMRAWLSTINVYGFLCCGSKLRFCSLKLHFLYATFISSYYSYQLVWHSFQTPILYKCLVRQEFCGSEQVESKRLRKKEAFLDPAPNIVEHFASFLPSRH